MNKTNEGDLKCLPRDFSGRDDPRRAIISGLISSFFDVKKKRIPTKIRFRFSFCLYINFESLLLAFAAFRCVRARMRWQRR